MTEASGQSKPKELAGQSDAIREAVEYGIDISLLRANLALTPTERMRRYQIALNTAEMLRRAKRL